MERELLNCTEKMNAILSEILACMQVVQANSSATRNEVEALRHAVVDVKALLEHPPKRRVEVALTDILPNATCNQDTDETGEAYVNEESKPTLMSPHDIETLNYGGDDLLTEFVQSIDCILEDPSSANIEYVASDQICATMPVTKAYDYADELQDNIRELFMAELPNIKRLYESVGWEVVLNAETDNLEFYANTKTSPYRQLLKEISGEECDLVTPRQVAEGINSNQ